MRRAKMSHDTIWDRKEELAELITYYSDEDREDYTGYDVRVVRYLDVAMLSLELWEEEYVKGNINESTNK